MGTIAHRRPKDVKTGRSIATHCMPMPTLLPAGPAVDFAGAFGPKECVSGRAYRVQRGTRAAGEAEEGQTHCIRMRDRAQWSFASALQ
jgi:hypothetical protein